MSYDKLKRGLDLIFGSLLLLVTAPLQLAISLVILSSMGRPIFFLQERPGKGGELFTLLKFRTMTPVDEGKKSDADRITGVGEQLRSTSLDELPTLWNVVKGDMSFVGPRPLLPDYLPLYTDEQARRHEVRPGITGLAQVKGRNRQAWEDRFKLDLEYVQRRSLGFDFFILVSTIPAVLLRRGIRAEGEATMRPFNPLVEGAEEWTR